MESNNLKREVGWMEIGTDTTKYTKVVDIQIWRGVNGLYDLWIEATLYHDISWERLIEIISRLK